MLGNKQSSQTYYDVRKVVGTNIKRLRQKRQLTQEHLAFYAGMSCAHLAKTERGLNNPTICTLQNIASVLGVKIEELFHMSED